MLYGEDAGHRTIRPIIGRTITLTDCKGKTQKAKVTEVTKGCHIFGDGWVELSLDVKINEAYFDRLHSFEELQSKYRRGSQVFSIGFTNDGP